MNLFFSGKLQAMPASYRTNCGRFEVIRPLIECEEARIAAFAVEEGFPILPCNLCGSQEGLKREAMAELLASLEGRFPNVRSVMTHALANVRPSHLLDTEVAAVWAGRPPEVRPDSAGNGRPAHARALPVLGSES